MSYYVMIIKDGICTFHRSYGELNFIDIHLVGGFFHALLTFSRELGEGFLDSIKYSNLIIFFKTVGGFTFVLGVRQSISITQNEVESILNDLASKFHAQFPDASNWNGNTSMFDGFTKVCDEILQKQPHRRGFPLLLKVTLKPLLLGPALQILFIKSEKQDYFYELNHQLEKYSEVWGHKKLKRLLEEPSIIYLPQSQKMVYLHAFHYQEKKGEISHLLCFIVEEKDWFMFYQLNSIIYNQTKRVLPKVMNFLQMYNKNPNSPVLTSAMPIIRDAVEDWADLNQYIGSIQASLFEEYYRSGMTSDYLTEEQAQSQFIQLISLLGEDFDKVIFGLLTQQQMVIVGEIKENVEQFLTALLNFYPHPSVVLWTEEPSDYLIVGTHPHNLPNFKEAYLIIDLINNKVIGGEKNEFCSDLIEKTLQLTEIASISEARIFFQGKISNLFSILKLLMTVMVMDEEKQQQELKTILKIHSPAALDLLAKMSFNLNMLLTKNIQKFLNVQKMADFMLPGFIK